MSSRVHPLVRVCIAGGGLLAAALLLAGCAGGQAVRTSGGTGPGGPQELTLTSGGAVDQAERLLVRRVDLLLEADHPDALAPRVEEIVSGAQGRVASLVIEPGDRVEAVLRIPAPRLEEVVAALEALAEVEEKQVSTSDVTEETADVEARLASAIAVRDRLRAYLDRASAVTDIIAVERELGRVQAEIEVLQGRLERLRTDVAMAEVHLTVRQRPILGPLGVVLAGAGWLISKLFVIRW